MAGNWHRQRVQVLTMPQIVQLVEYTEARYRSAVWLLALAGLRASELCGLRVMDTDRERHSVTVNEVQMWVKGELVIKGPKTASGVRTIPLPEWLVDDLSKVLDKRSRTTGTPVLATDRLFTSATGKPMLDHTLWRIISRARCGLHRVDRRHQFSCTRTARRPRTLAA
jgi:integrase